MVLNLKIKLCVEKGNFEEPLKKIKKREYTKKEVL